MSALPQDVPEEGDALWGQPDALDMTSPATARWELNGDQYEMFGLPPGPSHMFRQLLGQPAPALELLRRPEEQYEIFPELGAALTPKPPPPPGMVDDDQLDKLQHELDGVQTALVLEDEAKSARPDFGPAEPYMPGPTPDGRRE